jgi:peptide/nickel transport system substrate-binding protein
MLARFLPLKVRTWLIAYYVAMRFSFPTILQEVSILKKGRFTLASTLLMMFGLLVAGCGGGSSSNGNTNGNTVTYNYQTPSHKGGTLLYSDWEFPTSTNPLFNTSVAGVEVSSALWGAPFAVTPDGKLLPDELAEIPSQANGDVSKDGLTVTMKLNPNLKWSDGTPITSSDFKYWWKVNQDPASGAASSTGYDQITSFDTPDPHTAVLHYKQLFAPFLYYLPNAAPEHVWGSIPDAALMTTQNVNLTPKVTSGPYMVQDYASGQSFTMVPNKYFTSTSLHPTVLDKLVFKGYQSKDSLIAGYQAGETDHAEDFTLGDLQKISNLPGFQLTSGASYEHLDFNLSKPYLQDVNVRKAIYQAVDRCQLIQSLLSQPCNKLILNNLEPGLPDANTSLQGFPFDLNAAKQDMKAAGWDCSKNPCTKNGQAFPTLQLVTTSGNALRQNTVQVIKTDLGKLGIPVNLDGNLYPAGTLFGDYASGGILATGKYDLAEFAYVEGLDSDGNLYYSYHSSQIPSANDPAGQNFQHLNDPQLDQMLQQGRSTIDQQKRSNVYKNVQSYMIQQQAYQVPLYTRPNITLTDGVLGNYFPNPISVGNEWNVGDWFRKTQ